MTTTTAPPLAGVPADVAAVIGEAARILSWHGHIAPGGIPFDPACLDPADVTELLGIYQAGAT